MPSPAPSGLRVSLPRSCGATSRPARCRRQAGAARRVFLALEHLEGRWCPSTLYGFDLVAEKGQLNLTGMGTGPSINDAGDVAFVGDFGSGAQGLFVGDGTADGLQNINPTWSNNASRVFGDPVEINNNGEVLAVDRYSTNGSTQFTLRTWSDETPNAYLIYTSAGDRTTTPARSRPTPRSTTRMMSRIPCSTPAGRRRYGPCNTNPRLRRRARSPP